MANWKTEDVEALASHLFACIRQLRIAADEFATSDYEPDWEVGIACKRFADNAAKRLDAVDTIAGYGSDLWTAPEFDDSTL